MSAIRRAAFLHLVVLPRPFALPIAWAGIGLGLALSINVSLALALVAFAMGAALMAYAHSFNSWFDYAVTGLDRGPLGARSLTKPYTGGQNLIASGQVSVGAVVVNSLVWLALALVLAAVLATWTTPWLWPVIALLVACAPWYSLAKLAWHPEVPLGLGFATGATWVGMAASGEIAWGLGFAASLPLFVSFAVTGEMVDQAWDQGPNWQKGARSLGMLVARRGWPIGGTAFMLFLVAAAVQIALVGTGILSWWTLGAPAVVGIPMAFAAEAIDHGNKRAGVMIGLAAIIAYQVLMVMLQTL